MPFDPNASSRKYAADASRNAMKAHQQMVRHGRQFRERNRTLELQRSRAAPHRRSGREDHEDYPQDTPRRGRGVLGWVIVAAVTGLAVASIAFVGLRSVADGPGVVPTDGPGVVPADGIHATVRPGTAWNLRGGPGMAYAPIDVVQPGQDVIVACLERNWAKVTSPVSGFVYRDGLELQGAPGPC
jgi:hypothetical protein